MVLLGILRVVFIVLSAVFILVGVAGSILLGVLIHEFKQTDTIEKLFKLAGKTSLYDQMFIAFVVLIGACVVMLLTGCFGCCAMGRRRYNRCCQDTLALFALVLALLMLSGVVTTFIYRRKLTDAVQDSFQITMRAYNRVGGVSEKAADLYIDSTQEAKKCCGSTGYRSWRTLNTTWARTHPNLLAPESCCLPPSQANCNTVASGLYQRGCTGQLEEILEKAFVAIYIVGGAVSLLAFVEVGTACYMARTSNSGSGFI